MAEKRATNEQALEFEWSGSKLNRANRFEGLNLET
jgi:hypothetical protein